MKAIPVLCLFIGIFFWVLAAQAKSNHAEKWAFVSSLAFAVGCIAVFF